MRVVEMVLVVEAVMLENGDHASHQCLSGIAVSTSGEVLKLVKITNNQLQYSLY